MGHRICMISDKQVYAQNIIRQRFAFRNTKSLWKAFNESKIPYAMVKGAVLSQMAYGDFGARAFNDIDILLERSFLRSVREILLHHGFYENTGETDTVKSREKSVFFLSSTHQAVPFVKEVDGKRIEIDLNVDIFWGEYQGPRVNLSDFLAKTDRFKIYGSDIAILPPMGMLIQLILHHYKDFNSLYLLATRKTINADKLWDVYYLIKRNICAIPADLVVDICKKMGIADYAYYILYYTQVLSKDLLMSEYVEPLRTPTGDMLLDCYGLTAQERKKWTVNFETRLQAPSLLKYIRDELNEQEIKNIMKNLQMFPD